MDKLKPIAVRSFKDVYKFIFETQTDLLNCEQVAAGYNGMIIDLTTRSAEADALRAELREVKATLALHAASDWDACAELRATVAEQAKVIALNKYVTPPFDLCDDDTIELALECVKKDETIAKQAQTIETARERVTLLESVVTESCGDHPENSCESWCDQCKRGADALRKAFAANAPTPTQGETEGEA